MKCFNCTNSIINDSKEYPYRCKFFKPTEEAIAKYGMHYVEIHKGSEYIKGDNAENCKGFDKRLFEDYFKTLTEEESLIVKKRNIESRLEEWNKSYCGRCPLATDKVKSNYVHLGSFACKDPLGEVHIISNSILAKNKKDCDITKNIHNLIVEAKPKILKIEELAKENPKIKELFK